MVRDGDILRDIFCFNGDKLKNLLKLEGKKLIIIYTYMLLRVRRYNIKTINTVQMDHHAVLTVMNVEISNEKI